MRVHLASLCLFYNVARRLPLLQVRAVSATKRGQIYFRKSVVQLQARLGQSRNVIGALFSHIQKARGAVNTVDTAAREAAE